MKTSQRIIQPFHINTNMTTTTNTLDDEKELEVPVEVPTEPVKE